MSLKKVHVNTRLSGKGAVCNRNDQMWMYVRIGISEFENIFLSSFDVLMSADGLVD